MKIAVLCGVLGGAWGGCPSSWDGDSTSSTVSNDQRYAQGIWDPMWSTASGWMQTAKGYGKIMHSSGWHEMNLDIYMPHDINGDYMYGGEDQHPLIIWLHGGSFTYGSRKQPTSVAIATSLANNGWIAAAIEYRAEHNAVVNQSAEDAHMFLHASDAHDFEILAPAMDARRALRFLMHDYEHHVDAGNIFVSGGSSGGIIALHVGYGTRSNQHECDHDTCEGLEASHATIGNIKGVLAVSAGLATTHALSAANGPAVTGDDHWSFPKLVVVYGENDAGFVNDFIDDMEDFASTTAFKVPGGAHLPIVPYNFGSRVYHNTVTLKTDHSGSYWCTVTGMLNWAREWHGSPAPANSGLPAAAAAAADAPPASGDDDDGAATNSNGGACGWYCQHFGRGSGGRRQNADVFV